MNISDIVLILSGVISIILGIYIFFKNYKNDAHISFMIFSVLVGIWVISNFYIDFTNSHETALLFSKVTAIVNSFIPAAFLYFVVVFPKCRVKTYKKYLLPLLLVVSVYFGWQSLGNTIVVDVNMKAYPVEVIHGNLFAWYALYLCAFYMGAIAIMIAKLFSLSKNDKQKVQYLLFGTSIMIVTSLITNLLLPLFRVSSSLTRLGPSVTLIFVSLTTYTIIRHHLMDIHIVLRRSVIVFGVFCLSVILTSLSASYIARSMNGILVVSGIITILLLAAPYIKNGIDTFVRKIFPVELVDISTFFDRTIYKIRTESIEEFMRKLQKFITDNFHVESHVFLRDQEKKNWYTLVCGKKQKVKVEEILEKSIKISKMIIDGSELENEHSESDTLFVPMKYEDEVIGCIVLECTQEKDLSNEQAEMLCELGPRSAKVIHDLRVLERAKTGARILANRLQ